MPNESRPSQSRRTVRGFTLVELLVVLGIIAVLVSLLMPALNKARESARQVHCASTLRYIYTGVSLYNNLHQGKYPPTSLSFGGVYSSGWPQVLIYSQVLGNAKNAVEFTGTGFDAVFTVPMLRLFQCQTVPFVAGANTQKRTGCYAINGHTWVAPNSVTGAPQKFIRTTDIKLPARFWLLGENYNIPVDGHRTLNRPSLDEPDRWRTRHNKGGNYVFADGHQEWIAQAEINKQIQAFGPTVRAWPTVTGNPSVYRLPFGNADH